MTSSALTSNLPRVGVSIACFRGDEVLLVERGKPPLDGLWSLPGGSVEPGETIRDAALRELGEETGVEAEIVGLVDVLDVIRHRPDGALAAHFVLSVFAARYSAGTAIAADDARAVQWVTPDRLSGLATTDRLTEIVLKAREIVD